MTRNRRWDQRVDVLLSNEGRNIGLESTSAETKNDNTKDEGTNGLSAGQDGGDGRNNKQDMADDGEGNSNEDGIEATKVLIGNNGTCVKSDSCFSAGIRKQRLTENGGCVGPERVESIDTKRSTLAHSKRTWLTIRTRVLASGLRNAIDDRQVLLNVIRVCRALAFSKTTMNCRNIHNTWHP